MALLMIHLLVITIFMVLFLRDMMPEPFFGPVPHWWAATASLSLLAMAWFAAHMFIRLQHRRLEVTRQMRAMRRADFASGSLRLGVVLIHIFNVLALGWLDAVRSMTGNIIAVDRLIAALPALFVLTMSWWSMYPLERRLREAAMVHELEDGLPVRRPPGRLAFVIGPFRHHVAHILVPVALLVLWTDLVQHGATRFSPPQWLPFAMQMAGFAVVVTMMPMMMRHIWDTAALAPGPLRQQIVWMCQRHRVRVRELLLWRTHGAMVNGAVMGLLWPFRYILLTDALIDHLHPRQVEAVTAHEVGHVRLRHIPWLMGGAVASVVISSVVINITLVAVAGSWLSHDVIAISAAGGALAVAIVLFGFASRRFEWQADAFAVQHLSGYSRSQPAGQPVIIAEEAVHAMNSALDTVAHLNHMRRDKFTWRHGSIASRQQRLHALVGRRADQLKADRDGALVKLLTSAGLCIAAGLIVAELMM